MFKLIFFVPPAQSDRVKAAIFATGAGTLGNYAEVAFETPGTGQFRPLAGACPHTGHPGELTRCEELRVEILCTPAQIRPALDALVAAHPYESPAREVYRLAQLD